MSGVNGAVSDFETQSGLFLSCFMLVLLKVFDDMSNVQVSPSECSDTLCPPPLCFHCKSQGSARYDCEEGSALGTLL